MASRFKLTLVKPIASRIEVPSQLVTLEPFSVCPACGAELVESTRLRMVFSCGLVQMLTDTDEWAVVSCCPYALRAAYEASLIRIRRNNLESSMPSLPDRLSVGDKVKWVSQSAGRETAKKGIIVAEVPPNARPEEYIPPGMRKNSTNGYGKERPHISYLVRVSGKGSMVYWPRVCALEKI